MYNISMNREDIKNTPMEAFNKAGEKVESENRNGFYDAIILERPELEGKPAYFPEQGYCAYTIIIGDEVFKAPKKIISERNHEDEILREVEVLKGLEGSGLPVPKLTHVGKNACFFGMERMKGVKIPEDFIETFTKEQLISLAKDISSFTLDMILAFSDKEKFTPHDKVMVHFDLNLGNLLIDPDTNRLCGILDFGSSREVSFVHSCPSVSCVESNLSYKAFNNLLKLWYEKGKSKIRTFEASKATSGLKVMSHI